MERGTQKTKLYKQATAKVLLLCFGELWELFQLVEFSLQNVFSGLLMRHLKSISKEIIKMHIVKMNVLHAYC